MSGHSEKIGDSQVLTHTDASGQASMVDVGDKAVTDRRAVARAFVGMAPETLQLIRDNGLKKGDVLSVARLAGIMAAKKTHDLIPLCHPLALTKIDVRLELSDSPCGVSIQTEARCRERTGVEMEALTAASVAALTVYDMAKAVDRGMTIGDVCLLEKSGGRSGHWKKEP